MDTKQRTHVMTLANSIIGVSILAMPYCFKQCGIILSILLLLLSSAISRLACHFLMKSAMKARLRTFEFLAYHVFGSIGKLFVEIGLIGFLIGTCIAYFVVMGDLGPQIVTRLTETKNTDTLRTTILVALALFCVLPLGLLRKVDSLSGVCTATIGFYAVLVLKIMSESAPHLWNGDWMDRVAFWQPSGVLQCIPIFSMALCCQTQLFEIYQVIPNASLEKMNDVVREAVFICTSVYIFVGVFGYIAISHEMNFSGNILLNFKPSFTTEVMKIGFVLSLAFSFPLVIFPCRASLYSLLFKPTYTALHETSAVYIPEGRFRFLTGVIVSLSLVIGLLIPNIELVLGMVGSTIGILICVIFPSTCFICKTSKNTNERIIAQFMLFAGIVIMVLGTYANIYAMDQAAHSPVTEKMIASNNLHMNINIVSKEESKILSSTLKSIISKEEEPKHIRLSNLKQIRHEPAQPEPPPEDPPKEINVPEIKEEISKEEKKPKFSQVELQKDFISIQAKVEDISKIDNKETIIQQPDTLNKLKNGEYNLINAMKSANENMIKASFENKGNLKTEKNEAIPSNTIKKKEQELHDNNQEIKNSLEINKLVEENKKMSLELNLQKEQFAKVKEKKLKAMKYMAEELESKKNEEVALDAIQKEDQEIQNNNEEVEKSLEVKKLVEENKKISLELRRQKEQFAKVKEEKLKAMKDIANIAQLAIESLGDPINENEANPTPAALEPSGKLIQTKQIPETKSDKPLDINILEILSGMKINATKTNATDVKTLKPNEDNNLDSMRRDILAHVDDRKKRDVDEHCEINDTDIMPNLEIIKSDAGLSLTKDLKTVSNGSFV